MLAVIVMPSLRRSTPPELVRELAGSAGRRFAQVTSFGLFPTLVATGLLLAWHDGIRPDNITSSSFGRILLVKIAVVALVFVLGGLHAILARRLSRGGIRALAIATLILSVIILGLAAALAVLPGPNVLPRP